MLYTLCVLEYLVYVRLLNYRFLGTGDIGAEIHKEFESIALNITVAIQ